MESNDSHERSHPTTLCHLERRSRETLCFAAVRESASTHVATSMTTESPAFPEEAKAGPVDQAATCARLPKNSSRSALIWSLLVEHMPCGRPG